MRSSLDPDVESPTTDPSATLRKIADKNVTMGENRPE
jgi:hypothetical protein